MKILYLILHEFPKLSESFILREIIHLIEKGHDILVISLRKSKFLDHHKEFSRFPKEKIIYLNQIKKFPSLKFIFKLPVHRIFTAPRNPKTILSEISVLEQIINSLNRRIFKPTIIRAHFLEDSALMAAYLSSYTGIPFSVTVHAADIFVLPKNPIISFLTMKKKQDILKKTHRIIAISEYNKSFLEKNYRINPSNIKVVHCALDVKSFPQSRVKDSADQKTYRILSIGRLVEKKGFMDLLQAFLKLYENGIGINLELSIIGAGPLKQRIHDFIHCNELENNVKLLSNLKDDELHHIISNCDVFILACKKATDGDMDGIPLTLMEAMYMGLITISTRISGIPELIEDGDNGFLAQPGNVKSLIKVITKTFEVRDEWGRIRQQARRTIELNFNAEIETQKIISGKIQRLPF